MMIKNIVFDMGNVLIPYDPQSIMDKLCIQKEDQACFLREVFHTVEWAALDRGTMEEDQAAASMCARLPAHLHAAVEELFRNLHQDSRHYPDMYELAAELKKAGYKLYLLSNTSKRFHIFGPLVPTIQLMDGLFISCEVKLLKPDPAIYDCFFRRFSLVPEECYFIDDSFLNIEAALFCGMQGYVYRRDTLALRQALIQAGVKLA